MSQTTNPILRGFNPDPSIVRVGTDYYIATSTFEWFPGVQIHHSTDLANWNLITRPLDSLELADLHGVPDSCGVWAPCLSYCDGTFFLVYSTVKSFDGMWKDTPNFLITASDIRGPWSKPVFLNASGFDGSLFHDDDGRKWYTSMVVDYRKGKFFGGILLQEYCGQQQKLIGTALPIFEGSELGLTEGPHIYKLNGYYYLLTAEGGTEYGHAVSIARSRALNGPYVVHPTNPLITCAHSPDHGLQKAGHGDLVWTADNRCYVVFLVGRPLTQRGCCTLGRETAIEEIEWRDHWPYLAGGGNLPRLEIPSLANIDRPETCDERLDFSRDELSIQYQTLRSPIDNSWCNLDRDQQALRLDGRHSLASTFDQSIVARRVQHFDINYQIGLSFAPETFLQLAGLVCYYNTGHYFYLFVNGDEDGSSRFLNLVKCNNNEYAEVLPEPIALGEETTIHLGANWKQGNLEFTYSFDGVDWLSVSDQQDGSILSDDHVREGGEFYRPAFTGSFVGVCCQDMTGNRLPAYFKYLSYQENHP